MPNMTLVGIAITKAIDAINNSGPWVLVAAVDVDTKPKPSFRSRFPMLPMFESTERILEWTDLQPSALKAVYVGVPHHMYSQVIPTLL